MLPYAPEAVFKKLGDDLVPKLEGGQIKPTDWESEESQKLIMQALMVDEFVSHYGLVESVPENYRPMIIEQSRQLISEYNCTTTSEKQLAELAGMAYVRALVAAKRFNGCIAVSEYISDDRTRYLAVLSKELDRAHRQYLSALATLKQIKAPALEINVKAKTAFVAQNQQINAHNTPFSTNNENQ